MGHIIQKLAQRLGLRTVKTVLASVLAMVLCSVFPQTSPMLVLMGVYCGMGRTIEESWKSGLTQFCGVLAGSILGFLLLLVYPGHPQLWLIGLCLLPLILVCNLLKISYAVFLASMIFLSVCMGDSQPLDILARIRDTVIGLSIGMAVNAGIKPFTNDKRVYGLIVQLQAQTLAAVGEVALRGLYPDMKGAKQTMQALTREAETARQQVFPVQKRRQKERLVQIEACYQLAERMLHEAQALCSLDTFGTPAKAHCEKLLELGAEAGERAAGSHHLRDARYDAVMDHHLDCYLQAYQYLSTLLPKDEKIEK